MEIPKDAGREEIVGGQRVGDGDPRGAVATGEQHRFIGQR
jgi:hypothetical protein